MSVPILTIDMDGIRVSLLENDTLDNGEVVTREGDFSHIESELFQTLLSEAYNALDRNDWETLREIEPDAEEGFMWTRDERLLAIMSKVDAASTVGGHSGGSMGITMRQMQLIARLGWEEYLKL